MPLASLHDHAIPFLDPAFPGPPAASATAFRLARGLWFDGTRFVPGTRWSVDGRLHRRRPLVIDRTVDPRRAPRGAGLRRRAPPRHRPPQALDDKIARLPRGGDLLREEPERDPGPAHARGAPQAEPADTIDVTFSNGGLTATGGHPAPLHATSPRSASSPASSPRHGEPRLLHRRRCGALEAKWPAILEGHPDFIKTFLLFSEEFEKRRDIAGMHKGLDPKLLPAIVAKAHASGLRVSTHVDTAADFRFAVDAGVDEINHLPQPDPRFSADLSAYVIDPMTARRAAQKGIVVVTTAGTTERLSGNALPADWLPAMHANQRANIRTLLAAGVRVAIGSDASAASAPSPPRATRCASSRAHGLAGNLEILRMWCVERPRTIFPEAAHRRPRARLRGELPGAGGNPLQDLSNLERIGMRVKRGLVLPPMAGPVVLRRG
jgi:hypothetical protein